MYISINCGLISNANWYLLFPLSIWAQPISINNLLINQVWRSILSFLREWVYIWRVREIRTGNIYISKKPARLQNLNIFKLITEKIVFYVILNLFCFIYKRKAKEKNFVDFLFIKMNKMLKFRNPKPWWNLTTLLSTTTTKLFCF